MKNKKTKSKKGVFASLGYITIEDAMRVFEKQIASESNEKSITYIPKIVEYDNTEFSKWFQENREKRQEKFAIINKKIKDL